MVRPVPAGDRRKMLRLLSFIAKGRALPAATAQAGRLALESADHGVLAVDAAILAAALSRGLVARAGNAILPNEAGRAWLRRYAAVMDPFAAQHRAERLVTRDDGASFVLANDAESPLTLLRSRKDATGQPLISEEAFKAGERLRQDFTLGQMLPSIGVDWSASGSGTRRNGMLEATDAALAARQRVEQALEAVGPELADVLIDICCFLKGLEMVERERSWPVRSAKVVLKTALAVLDRHYNPAAPGRRSKTLLHWGAADYRPQMPRS